MEPNGKPPGNISFYNFTAIYPADGNCEFRQIGELFGMKEFGSFICCFISSFIGIYGIRRFDGEVRMFILYLYGLIIGFGITRGLYHVTLWNGFARIGETIDKFHQSLLVVYLASSFRNSTLNRFVLFVGGMYPMLAIVLSSSFANDWIGWLDFDFIWVFVAAFGIPSAWSSGGDNWYFTIVAAGCIVAAYGFWLIDQFCCSKWTAILQFHGMWHILLSLGYFNLNRLTSFVANLRPPAP